MAVQPPSVLNIGDDTAAGAAIALLIHYFDLAPASAQLLVKKWRHQYPVSWTRAAVTEALYQGRYKPISVEQILAFWQRRGRTIPHFNAEFETIIAVPLQQEFDVWEADPGGAPPLTLDLGTVQPGSQPPSGSQQPSQSSQSTSPGAASPAIASPPPLRPRLKLPGERPRSKTGFETLLEPPGARPRGSDGSAPSAADRLQITQGPDPANLAQAKAQQFQPPPIGRFVPAQDDSGFSSRLRAVAEQINGNRLWSPAEAASAPDSTGADGTHAPVSGLADPALAQGTSSPAQLPPLPSAAVPGAIASAVEGLLRQQGAVPPEETGATNLPPEETGLALGPQPRPEDAAALLEVKAVEAEGGELEALQALEIEASEAFWPREDLPPDDLAHPDFVALDVPVASPDSELPSWESPSLESTPAEAATAETSSLDPAHSEPINAAFPRDKSLGSTPPSATPPRPLEIAAAPPEEQQTDMTRISELLASLTLLGDEVPDADPGIDPD